MKFKKSYWTIIAPTVIVIFIVVYFSAKIPFYSFDTSVASANFSIKNNSVSKIDNQILWYTYDNGDIILNLNMLINSSDVEILAKNMDMSIVAMKSSEVKTTMNMTGHFIAYTKAVKADMNGDGKEETVYASAKTETIVTQGFSIDATPFNQDSVPFELTFANKNSIILYYNKAALSNQTVLVNSIKGKNRVLKTDATGMVKGLSLNEIRKGINVTYQSPEGKYYTMSYQVEENTLFTQRHNQAMTPLYIIAIAIIGGVVIVAIIRNHKGIVRGFKRYRFQDTMASVWDIMVGELRRLLTFKWDFMTIRWIIMIGSFLFFCYGLQFFGAWIPNYEIPAFACPKNTDQILSSSCWYLCHSKYLFMEDSVKIAIFFISFFGSIIVFGRTICGFICPMGMMQDVVYELRQIFKVRGISFNEKINSALKIIKWQMLLIFLGAIYIGLDFCAFCPAIITTPAFSGFKLSLAVSGFVVIALLIVSFFKRRFWCNICPLGFLMGLFHKISIFKLKKNCQSCTECGACYEACPMGIKSIYTERSKEDITTSNCIMCGECVKKCPENDAIAIAIVKKKIYTASRFKFFNIKKKK